MVTSVIDAKAKQRDPNEGRQTKENCSFDEVLKKTCERNMQQDEVICNAAGYTRDAKSFYYDIKMGRLA